MIYLSRFKILNNEQESELKIKKYDNFISVYDLYARDEHYPAKILSSKELTSIDFEDITILYGGNGSGKTTLLNIISEKLKIFRYMPYLQTDVFHEYIKHCKFNLDKEMPLNSKFLSSDDIFNHILLVRDENKSIKKLKKEKEAEYDKTFTMSKKKFIRSRAGELQRQYSNGENALIFFDKQIEENALYLLDEPENSLSPKFQLELKTLIEDSVRCFNCQFIIATHSLFMLSLKNAKIYNLDETPVTVKKWYELENVKLMYEIFKENKEYFEW